MPSLRPWVLYAGRRWRTTGLVVVALLGTVVYGVVADRGHDPLWLAEGSDLHDVAVAHDGAVAYALRQSGADPAGRALEAYETDGALLWNRTLGNATVHVGTGRGWVAVASVGEPSRLAVYRAGDGVLLFEAPVDGTPRGLASEGETVALALQSPENTVLVFHRMAFDRAVQLPTFVTALDVASGNTVAAGTADGEVVVDRAGREIARFDVDVSVRSIRLDADASRLVVGGFGPDPGDLSGGVAAYDLDPERGAVPLWSTDTLSGVGMVDVSADGSVVVALEETPGRSVLRVTPGDGGPAKRYVAPGIVPRVGTSGEAGARLAPDGSGVALATLTGDVVWVDAATAAPAWTWRARGGTEIEFATERPDVLVASVRLYPSEGYDRLARFDAAAEPFASDMARLVPVLVLAELAAGAMVLGVGRFRELRG